MQIGTTSPPPPIFTVHIYITFQLLFTLPAITLNSICMTFYKFSHFHEIFHEFSGKLMNFHQKISQYHKFSQKFTQNPTEVNFFCRVGALGINCGVNVKCEHGATFGVYWGTPSKIQQI